MNGCEVNELYGICKKLLMQLQDRTNNVYYLGPAEIDNHCRNLLFFLQVTGKIEHNVLCL